MGNCCKANGAISWRKAKRRKSCETKWWQKIANPQQTMSISFDLCMFSYHLHCLMARRWKVTNQNHIIFEIMVMIVEMCDSSFRNGFGAWASVCVRASVYVMCKIQQWYALMHFDLEYAFFFCLLLLLQTMERCLYFIHSSLERRVDIRADGCACMRSHKILLKHWLRLARCDAMRCEEHFLSVIKKCSSSTATNSNNLKE